MGPATRQRGPVKTFEPAFSMEVGEIRGPFRIKKGMQLLKVIERLVEKFGSFDEEKANTRKILESRKRQKDVETLFGRLRDEFEVVIY